MSHRQHDRYWRRYITPNEQIIHCFGVSRWYIFVFWFVPFLIVADIAWYLTSFSLILASFLAVTSLGALFPAIYLAYFVHYAITDQRVMTREGFLNTRFVTAGLPQITDITVKEYLLERIFTRTGVIGVNTAGTNYVEIYFRHIAKPNKLREDIFYHQQILRSQQNPGTGMGS